MVKNNSFENRFEVEVGNELAVLEYRLRGETLHLVHTEVPPAGEGKGFGGQLAKAALEYARENRLKVAPMCSFVAVYIKRHPQYADLVGDQWKTRIA